MANPQKEGAIAPEVGGGRIGTLDLGRRFGLDDVKHGLHERRGGSHADAYGASGVATWLYVIISGPRLNYEAGESRISGDLTAAYDAARCQAVARS
ncbi:MAG: hypothetical protein ACXWC1_30790 [Burkholderiales bacterium]